MVSIRGAITIKEDSKDQVLENTRKLLSDIIEKNNIKIADIISIVFTCTNDIKSAYPAVAAREMGITNAGLMCLNEMFVENSLKKCIRVLLLMRSDMPQSEVHHIYLEKAIVLRPDLNIKK